MSTLTNRLLIWFDIHGRTTLPWQIGQKNKANVYHVWLSEIMLQQTQVITVIDYFNCFIKHFPTLNNLANASEDAVLAQWAGLGYYARARNLHKTAKIVVQEYQGNFPQDIEQVIALPGIGKSTAGAILTLSFNQTHAILDGNVKRVLARVHQVKGHYAQSNTLKELWKLSEYHTPYLRTDHYTQAIMDLGATLCTRSKPDCSHCPINSDCLSYIHHTQGQYPNPKPKRPKPSRSIAMLIFTKNNQIYLQKRPNKGIWGGLWSFIECDDDAQSIDKSIRTFDSSASVTKKLPIFKHTFTHYHLHVHPILIDSPLSSAKFYPLDQTLLGMPKPVVKIIAQLTEVVQSAN